MAAPIDQKDIDRINQALFAGRLIEAIKIYRTATGCGLAEAKDFIESLEARLRQQSPEQFTAPPRTPIVIRPGGCGLLIALVALAIAAWLILAR